MSAFSPVDTTCLFAREEIEEAFAHYWRLGGAGERWNEFSDLYTEDAVLIDRVIEGTKNGREEIRSYLDFVMNQEMPALYTVYDWHTIQGNCVSNGMINRFDNPKSGGPALDFAGVTIQVYAGDGLWSYQEDYYSWEGMQRVRSDYEKLCAEYDPQHPKRRTRREWPSSPDWAIGLAQHPDGI
jgi:ketosteroid isomerase-like protein